MQTRVLFSYAAVKNPGVTYWARKTGYRKSGSFLRCILPSGRSIWFPFPRLARESLRLHPETQDTRLTDR